MATATETRVEGFIVMTRDHHWGWGATPEDAIKVVRQMGGKAPKGERLVYKLPTGAQDAYVDQMGSIVWEWAENAPDRNAVGTYDELPK